MVPGGVREAGQGQIRQTEQASLYLISPAVPGASASKPLGPGKARDRAGLMAALARSSTLRLARFGAAQAPKAA
jgi:hypothetical protein